LEPLIRDALDRGSQLIVVGGGDGTIRCAAGVLARTEAALGVLPLGTVNDFARNLGIEPTLEAACKVIAGGKTAHVDLAQANGDYFVITASFGLSALTQTVLSPPIKKLFGPFGYVLAALLAWRKLNHLHIQITHDGKTEEMKVMQAGVINGHSWMGGKFEIPGVDLDSGRMAFYAVPPQTIWDYFRIARHVRLGEFFKTPGFRAFTTLEIYIKTRKPYPMVLDGDICGKTPVTLKIVPEALRVCVPTEFLEVYGKQEA